MKTYEKYKSSAIDWLGEIPEHWEVKRAKTMFNKLARTVRPHDDTITCFRDGVVTLRKNRRVTGFTESFKEIGYQGIRKGDLVIHAMDAFAGSVGVSDSDGKGTPVYHVCVPIGEYDNYYYAHIIKEMARTNFIQSLYRGIRERSSDFRFNVFGKQQLPIPPLAEQEQIVRFLDSKISQINRFVRGKKREIELLKELKKAEINQAVTKGLNPNAQLKDSGIEWLGEIPEHWEVKRIGTFGKFSKGSGISRAELQTEGVAAILYGDIYTKYQYSVANPINRISEDTAKKSVKIEYGNLLFTASGETKEDIGKCIAFTGISHTYVGGDVIIFKQSNQSSLFLSYVLNSNIANYQKYINSKGDIIVHTYASKLKNICIPIPPLAEQQQIVAHLSDRMANIDTIIAGIENEIKLVQEYKTCLISDAVTGKIDVRHIVIPDTEIFEEIEEQEVDISEDSTEISE